MRDRLVESLIKEAAADEGKLCSAVRRILAHLLEQNQAYRAQLHPDEVGIHPSNRDGGGVEESHVHALAAKIATLGFLWDQCSGAVCVEDDKHMTIADFTVATLSACPRLAPAEKSRIRYGSLSCSHTNQFLRSAAASVLCDIPEISDNQRMSASKMCIGDNALADALEKGLQWLVIKADVIANFPELPTLIQSSRNAPGHLHMEETQADTMMKMLTLSLQHVDNGRPNWNAVRAELEKTCSKYAQDFYAIQKYIQKWAGGREGFYLKELQRFWATRVPHGRSVSASFLAALADLPIDANELCPRLITALVKAQAACPPHDCAGGVCKMISLAEIKSLRDKVVERNQAEQILKQSRETLAGHGQKIQPAEILQLQSNLDLDVATALLSKATGPQKLEPGCIFASKFSFYC